MLGLGCCVSLLSCCGVVVALFFFFESAKRVTRDPEAIRRQAALIATFDLPEGFTANLAISLKNPATGEGLMTMVIYSEPDHDSAIVLAQFGELIAERGAEEMERRIDGLMQRQGQQLKRVEAAEYRDVEVEIGGRRATFKVQRGDDQRTKQQFVQVESIFEGKQGRAMLIGQFKASHFTETDAETFVRSIK